MFKIIGVIVLSTLLYFLGDNAMQKDGSKEIRPCKSPSISSGLEIK